ncbi:MAG: signal peptidase II [Anaerolineales bacterium]|nr:signal peptidase II [Anaerolineales bacterium]
MNRFKKALLIGVVLFSCVGCDQVTKSIAAQQLPVAEPIRLLGDTVRLQYTSNTGGFLGLGASLPQPVRFGVFSVMTAVILAGALWYAWASTEIEHPAIVLGVALILAGGIGNLIDRLVNDGHVVDFMNIGIGDLRTGVFNVADVAIMAGPALLLVGMAMLRKAELAEEKGEDQAAI